jgi:hypothetical protein
MKTYVFRDHVDLSRSSDSLAINWRGSDRLAMNHTATTLRRRTWTGKIGSMDALVGILEIATNLWVSDGGIGVERRQEVENEVELDRLGWDLEGSRSKLKLRDLSSAWGGHVRMQLKPR